MMAVGFLLSWCDMKGEVMLCLAEMALDGFQRSHSSTVGSLLPAVLLPHLFHCSHHPTLPLDSSQFTLRPIKQEIYHMFMQL